MNDQKRDDTSGDWCHCGSQENQKREQFEDGRRRCPPHHLDQGDDATDFPGDEFLLGYWLGRYIGAIGAN